MLTRQVFDLNIRSDECIVLDNLFLLAEDRALLNGIDLGSFSKVVVATGFLDSAISEVINLNPDNDSVICQPLNPTAVDLRGATGGLLYNSEGKPQPILCGGYDIDTYQLKTLNKKCYNLLDPGSQLVPNTALAYSASAVVQNELFISGGSDEHGQNTRLHFSVNLLASDNNGGGIPVLPLWLEVATSGHCMLYIQDLDHLMIIGGESEPRTTYFLDDWKNWDSGPLLTWSREHSSCGVISDLNESNKTIVIVAGSSALYGGGSRTEILTVGTETWTEGPALPHSIFRAAAVSNGNTFILIGGKTNDLDPKIRKELYALQCSWGMCIWTKMEQELQQARHDHVAILIPNDMLNCT